MKRVILGSAMLLAGVIGSAILLAGTITASANSIHITYIYQATHVLNSARLVMPLIIFILIAMAGLGLAVSGMQNNTK